MAGEPAAKFSLRKHGARRHRLHGPLLGNTSLLAQLYEAAPEVSKLGIHGTIIARQARAKTAPSLAHKSGPAHLVQAGDNLATDPLPFTLTTALALTCARGARLDLATFFPLSISSFALRSVSPGVQSPALSG